MVSVHRPVMLNEVLTYLVTKPEGIYVDGTFGRGGHSRAILEKLNAKGRLIAFDKDPDAVAAAQELAANDARFTMIHASFAAMKSFIETLELSGKIDGIFLDLGVSSPQLDNADRGFSFMREGPLDMRMDTTRGKSAAAWLAAIDEKTLIDVLHVYGEERHARRIARAIIAARTLAPITTTTQLAKIVSDAQTSHDVHKHPATRTFQAIRIVINRELEDLQDCLAQCLSLLTVGGRLLIISFHSLEDRLVKRFIKKEVSGDHFPAGLPVKESQLNKRLRLACPSLKPSADEIHNNARARSAVLRIAEKIA